MTRLSTDPADWTRIAILCPSCQARHNTPHRLAASRRTVASRCGQLWLSDELLYAAAPPRFWPDHLRQLPLFD